MVSEQKIITQWRKIKILIVEDQCIANGILHDQMNKYLIIVYYSKIIVLKAWRI